MKGLTGFVLWAAVLIGALYGMSAMGGAKSAVHEIEALICFLIVTVAAAAGHVGSAIGELKPKVEKPKAAEKEAA